MKKISLLCYVIQISFFLSACTTGKSYESDVVSSSGTSLPSSYTGITYPSQKPSVGTVVGPTAKSTPEQVLRIFIECLKKGDTDTLCTLFANSDPEYVAKQARFAFCGPLEIWDIEISVDETHHPPDTSISGSEIAYMYFFFWSKDTNGEFGLTEPGTIEVCRFPQLQKIDGVWKIITLGCSSP